MFNAAPDDAGMNGVFSAIRTALITLGTALVSAGVLTKESPVYFWIMTVAGLVLVVGPAVWGVVVAVQHAMAVRQERAKAAQGTLNLLASGGVLDVNGNPIKMVSTGTGNGAPVPKPVTIESAAEIAKLAPAPTAA